MSIKFFHYIIIIIIVIIIIYPHVNSANTITTLKGHVNNTGHFMHHWQRGLLFDVHQMSIDSLHWRDWRQVGGSFQRTPLRCHQREKWPSFACFLQPGQSLSHTEGHEGCGIVGRLSQPGLLQEAREAFDFRWGTEWFRVALIKTLVSHELLTFLPTHAGARCHVRHAR